MLSLRSPGAPGTNQIQNLKLETKPGDHFSPFRSFNHSVIDSSFGFRISGFRARRSVRHSDFGFRTSFQAFTLVELMISLAMVLILILGINFVFRSATDAVGAGQALNVINSDAQSAQPVIFDDLRNVSKNPPCFIIASQFVIQFLNSDDAKTSSDPTVIVTDNNGDTVKIGNGAPPAFFSPAILDGRRHRADLLKFLAHGNYHRRSGNDGTYYGSESSDDAFIEFGHAALPTNAVYPDTAPAGPGFGPAAGTAYYGPSSAPNNIATITYSNGQQYTGVPRIGAYASDWVLARRVTLLMDKSLIAPPATNDVYYPVGASPNDLTSTGAQFGANMTPLGYASWDSNAANTTQSETYNPLAPRVLPSNRYDLAGVTPEQFDRVIANAILTWQNTGAYMGASLWWNPLVYAFAMSQGTATTPQYYSMSSATTPLIMPPYVIPYINSIPTYSGAPANIDPGQWLARPACNPTVQTPVTAATLAQMAPYFLQHCSQFIVEYAGDYMQQDVNGNMTGLGPDGQIDFYLDANSNKHIRWYGMPRSSTGSLHPDGLGNNVLIRGFDASAGSPDTLTEKTTAASPPPMTFMLNYFTDVIPLRDYYSLWFNTYAPANPGTIGAYAPPWETDINFDPTHDYGCGSTTYATPNAGGPNKNAFNNPANPPRYVAAWHDDMPAMVRILIKVDDPNNKVKDGPWYEYVFRLK
jgi:type II secretory pathway pseudopilin PulG